MSLDKTNVYFTALSASTPGSFVIDLRHAKSGIVLDMAEALQVQGLPEDYKLRSHPALPGRAAWEIAGHILQVSITMRRAGFASSPEEILNPREVAPKPAPKPQDAEWEELKPGIYIQKSGSGLPAPAPEEPLTRERVVFNVKTRIKDGASATEVQFGRTYADYPEDEPDDLSKHELETEGHWDDVVSVIGERSDKENWRLGCQGDEAATISGLEALGFTRDERVFMWFDPSELEFGISNPSNPDHDLVDDGYLYMFIIPKDENAPYFDDLRGGHLPEEPHYFDDNMSENTFQLKAGTDRDMVIADMKARGYTHNPELDGEAGG